MGWTAPKTYIAGTVDTASDRNTYERDNFIAVQAGTVALTKVTLDGDTSDPAVSSSGEAVLAYRTDLDEIRVSKNGGAYESLGGFDPLNSAVLAGGTMFWFKF